MDKLMLVQPIVSPEAEAQAASIVALMEQATEVNRSYIAFTLQHGKKMHPQVYSVLVSKGYNIREVPLGPHIDPDVTSYAIFIE